MMNQSNGGLKSPSTEWDRLAMVIDKELKTARYYQLPPGELEWEESLPQRKISFRVSCFLCHANGPRLIRPDFDQFSISFWDRAKIFLWNARIKTYGRLKEDPSHLVEDKNDVVPFRHRNSLENETLQLLSCTKCHNENDSKGRGRLTRQNGVTIRFMIDQQFMPPEGSTFSDKDKALLEDFLSGL